MRNFRNMKKEEVSRFVHKIQKEFISTQSPAQLYKGLSEAEKENRLNKISSYVTSTFKHFNTREDLEMEKEKLNELKAKFDEVFLIMKQHLEENWDTPYSCLVNKSNFELYFEELANLSLWDDDFADDLHGELSPFGPMLELFQNLRGKRRTGILHAVEQQLAPIYGNNLRNAQKLAVEIYNQFLKFVEANQLDKLTFVSKNDLGILDNLRTGYKYSPIVQLCAGGAAAILTDFSVPTLIALDKTKIDRFSKFSALSHEVGHSIANAFNESRLIDEMKTHVTNLNIPYAEEFWGFWIEECFADAIGVAVIKELEIFSLANLFSEDEYTNKIYIDSYSGAVDEHPNRHIRVLLTIEVGRKFGKIEETILKKTWEEWNDFGGRKNTDIEPGMIMHSCSKELFPIEEFVEGIEAVAEALVNDKYDALNGKSVNDIIGNFESGVANDMIKDFGEDDKKWV